MKTNETTVQGCPYDDLTESLCLNINLSDSEKRKAQIHLQQCELCRAKFEELEGIYAHLNEELEKPVTNQALDLAKKLRNQDTTYGLVVCRPLKSKGNKTRSFKTKVLFTANGTGTHKDKSLQEFNLDSLPKDSIAIRAMTDKSCDRLLLYLWSSNGHAFEGLELKVPDQSRRAIFDKAGVSSVPMMEIQDLGDKVIYFKEKHNTETASENRFENIFKAISL